VELFSSIVDVPIEDETNVSVALLQTSDVDGSGKKKKKKKEKKHKKDKKHKKHKKHKKEKSGGPVTGDGHENHGGEEDGESRKVMSSFCVL